MLLMERGHDREWLWTLTLQQIGDLYLTSQRIHAQETIERTYLGMASAQGQAKDLKKVLAPFTKLLSRKKDEKRDFAAFLRKYGGGI